MNKLFKQIFKKAGVNARVSVDSNDPKFKVIENKLTLEGVVKNNTYSMTIKDTKGKVMDRLSVSVKNTNDVVNRINESLTTLKMISEAYDKKQLREEDEEFEDVIADEEPADLMSGLGALYNSIMDTAEQAESLFDSADGGDAEQMITILGFSSALYDCANEVSEYAEELSEPDDVDEAFSRTMKKSKGFVNQAIDNLSMCESLLKGCPEYKDVLRAVKDIKSELIVRG